MSYDVDSKSYLSALRDVPGPSPEAVERMYTASIAAATTGTAIAVASTSAAKGTATGLAAIKGKLILTAALITGAGTGGTVLYSSMQKAGDRAPVTRSQPQVVPTVTPLIAMVEEQAVPVPILLEDGLEAAALEFPVVGIGKPSPKRAKTKARPKRDAAKTVPTRAVATLPLERKILQRARLAMKRKEYVQASLALQAHEQSFTGGILREEREALWVTLLMRQDNRTAAKERAEQFAKEFPGSLHLVRMQMELEIP